MADSPKSIDISILGRSYRIACEENERAGLLEAVAYLDGKMAAIKKSGKVSGTDRIAVMAALNIAHESLQARTELKQVGVDVGEELRKLNARIDAALAKS